MGTRIIGTGFYIPERVVTNDDLSQFMDTSDEWIQTRSGIKTRHYVSPDQSTSDLAYEAACKALKNAGLKKEDIDCIVFATISPDHYFPGTGCFLQAKLGCPNIPAIDIRAQCSGFLYALTVTKALLENGQYKTALVVGAEIHSKGLDFSNAGRDVSVLFGDGAAAVVLKKDPDYPGIIDIEIGADGRGATDLWLSAPGTAFPRFDIDADIREKRLNYPQMNGRKVFQFATAKMESLARTMLARHDLNENDISMVICHQANARIIEFVKKSLGWADEKFYINIDKYANTTAASIPIALSEAIETGKLKTGDKVLLLSFGSGYTWGASLLQL